MSLMVTVYRAPMRSRNDALEPEPAIDRARRLGLCGFGQYVSGPAERERLDRRVARFAELDDGSFAWTRDTDGWYWLGRITGPYFYDADKAAAAVDLVHVRPCQWLPKPLPEQDVPPAVVATFGRGGRNFQQIHDRSIGEETQRIWDARRNQPRTAPKPGREYVTAADLERYGDEEQVRAALDESRLRDERPPHHR